ncbi:hypothetical protein ACT7DF_20690 [Bacillus cereus]
MKNVDGVLSNYWRELTFLMGIGEGKKEVMGGYSMRNIISI